MPEPMSDDERADVLARIHNPRASRGQIRWAQRRIAADNQLRDRLDRRQQRADQQ